MQKMPNVQEKQNTQNTQNMENQTNSAKNNKSNQYKCSRLLAEAGGWANCSTWGPCRPKLTEEKRKKEAKNSCYKRYKSQIAQTNAKHLPPEFHLYNHLHKYVSSQECVGKTGSTIASHAKIVTLLSPTIGSLWLLFWRLSNARSLTQGNTNFKTILTAQNAPKLHQPNNVIGSSHSSTALLIFKTAAHIHFLFHFPSWNDQITLL